MPQGGAATASTYQSLEITKTYELRQQCNYQTCNGCVDLNVQRLCYGAQQCTIARCIGTLTNQNRPMCGLGQAGQAAFITLIALIHSGWNVFIETLTTIIGLSLSQDAKARGMQIRWIDDNFYSVMCSAKDITATLISIITSTLNFLVQV